MLERDLASEFIDTIKANNAKCFSLAKLIAEFEIALIKFMKHDHETKNDLAYALKLNRTTLSEKMKRYRISF